jgi:hypothetical protein
MSAFTTSEQESGLFLSLNNDITKIAQALDSSQEIKKLIYYIDKNPLQKEDVADSLVDKTIWRTPLIPLHNETDIDASYISVNLLMEDIGTNRNNAATTIAIDVWSPPEQWIINDGLRPLIICNYIDKIMRTHFVQTSGVKYRLDRIINAKLSDRLLGYRMVYETILEH